MDGTNQGTFVGGLMWQSQDLVCNRQLQPKRQRSGDQAKHRLV